MAPEPPSETWLHDVRAALARLRWIFLGQVVPGEHRYELVLTTREAASADRVEALRAALGGLLDREDSPVAQVVDGVRAASWHFFPAIGEREHELFAGLDWSRAVVVHTRSDE